MGDRGAAPEPGRVIVLNGTSSAGKTTLARALQTQLGERHECWLLAGIDEMTSKLPYAWCTNGPRIGAHADDGFTFTFVDGRFDRKIGPDAATLMRVYRESVAAYARAGLNTILDEVVLGRDDWLLWLEVLDGLEVRWVKVDLPLEVVEERERARGDRVIGLARSQYEIVHRDVIPDVVVDTAELTAEEAAAHVVASLTWE